MKINDSTPLVVTITFEKSDKKYGIIYEGGHDIPIDAKDRDFLNENTHSYMQSCTDPLKGRGQHRAQGHGERFRKYPGQQLVQAKWGYTGHAE